MENYGDKQRKENIKNNHKTVPDRMTTSSTNITPSVTPRALGKLPSNINKLQENYQATPSKDPKQRTADSKKSPKYHKKVTKQTTKQ